MAIMTRQQYEVIAKALKASRPVDHHQQSGLDEHQRQILRAMDAQWVNTVEKMCDALQTTNPRFDRDFFTTYIQIGRYEVKKRRQC